MNRWNGAIAAGRSGRVRLLVLACLIAGCSGGADQAEANQPANGAAAPASPSGPGAAANQPASGAAAPASAGTPAAAASVGGLAERARRARILPEDAVFAGGPGVPSQGMIEFHSKLRPERLLAWYRSAERRRSFRLVNQLQEGAEHVIDATAPPPVGAFTVRLAPGVTGGSTALILFAAGR